MPPHWPVRCDAPGVVIQTLDELLVYRKALAAAHAVAHYLYIARGSAKETTTHLVIAEGRRHLDRTECEELCGRYDEIARMSTGLIHHLERENRKHRWLRNE